MSPRPRPPVGKCRTGEHQRASREPTECAARQHRHEAEARDGDAGRLGGFRTLADGAEREAGARAPHPPGDHRHRCVHEVGHRRLCEERTAEHRDRRQSGQRVRCAGGQGQRDAGVAVEGAVQGSRETRGQQGERRARDIWSGEEHHQEREQQRHERPPVTAQRNPSPPRGIRSHERAESPGEGWRPRGRRERTARSTIPTEAAARASAGGASPPGTARASRSWSPARGDDSCASQARRRARDDALCARQRARAGIETETRVGIRRTAAAPTASRHDRIAAPRHPRIEAASSATAWRVAGPREDVIVRARTHTVPRWQRRAASAPLTEGGVDTAATSIPPPRRRGGLSPPRGSEAAE